MTHMAQQAILVRISFLEGDIANIRKDIIASDGGNELMDMRHHIELIEERIDENKQWMRVLVLDEERHLCREVRDALDSVHENYWHEMDQHEERDYALEHPQHIREEDADTTPQNFMATREMVKRKHTEMAIERMDGEGPIAADEDVE